MCHFLSVSLPLSLQYNLVALWRPVEAAGSRKQRRSSAQVVADSLAAAARTTAVNVSPLPAAGAAGAAAGAAAAAATANDAADAAAADAAAADAAATAAASDAATATAAAESWWRPQRTRSWRRWKGWHEEVNMTAVAMAVAVESVVTVPR